MNQTVLQNLEYVSGANMWANLLCSPESFGSSLSSPCLECVGSCCKDTLHVTVADNGYAQWNQSVYNEYNFSPNLTYSSEIEIFVDKENDPPVLVMPESIVIMEGGQQRLLGGHFVDFDANEFACKEDPFSIIYEMGIEVQNGLVTLDFVAPQCSVFFRPLQVLREPKVDVNVDGREEYKDKTVGGPTGAPTTGLFLDGSQVLVRKLSLR